MAFGLLALFTANGHAAAAQFAADGGFVLMGVGHDGVLGSEWWGTNCSASVRVGWGGMPSGGLMGLMTMLWCGGDGVCS